MSRQERGTTTQTPQGREIKILTLYSEEALSLLRQALDVLEQSQLDDGISQQQHRRTDSSSSEDDEESSSGSSSSEDESELEERQRNENEQETSSAGTEPTVAATAQHPSEDAIQSSTKQTDRRKRKQSKRKNETQAVKQRMGLPPMMDFALETTSESILQVPAALVPKEDCADPITMCQSCVSLAQEIGCENKKLVVILLLRSGRFAGGVFEGSQCLAHRACQRYTTRKGQGKAQSSLDSSGKGKAKSMGAQLRRAGELNLQEDVTSTLSDWQMYLNSAAIILLSCPKTMKKSLFENGETYKFLPRDDARIRRVPLDFGRPTFESVCAVYDVMMQVTVREKQPDQTTDVVESTVVDTAAADARANDEPRSEQAPKKEVEITPLTPIHAAASEGNLSFVTELLASDTTTLDEQIDIQAGPDCMTPLHYAAMSSSSSSSTAVDPSMAATMVSALLVQCHANPCIVDSRNRSPYFLASHEKVRDAFRSARATLGEDYCLWEDGAKVGPPLTSDNVKQRKEKAAEKKRRQRARQKEKKAKEKQHAADMERLEKEQEEQRKQEEDAKRIRDGLQPKKASSSGGNNLCDFCQKVCKGKRRAQMFQRLDYVYCSSECVQKHKRELMASAALSRFGG